MTVLSKSKYMTGLSCPKYLWCMVNKPEMISPFDASTLACVEPGHEVGTLAKKRYPKGIEIAFTKEAIKDTAKLLLKKVPLFEASFSYKNALAI